MQEGIGMTDGKRKGKARRVHRAERTVWAKALGGKEHKCWERPAWLGWASRSVPGGCSTVRCFLADQVTLAGITI